MDITFLQVFLNSLNLRENGTKHTALYIHLYYQFTIHLYYCSIVPKIEHSFRFWNFTWRFLHLENLHAHRYSKIVTIFKFSLRMISILLLWYLVKINNLVFAGMKIPVQYPFLYCQCNTPRIDIVVFAQLWKICIRDYSRGLFCHIKWCRLRCNPSCLYSSTNNGLFYAFHAYHIG